MPEIRLEGMFVPNVTPFKRDGDLDEESLRRCVRFWVESGVSGFVPCGSNGEAPYLSREERKKVIETVLDEVDGKVPVIAGTGSMSTKETIQLTKDAENLGVDAALIVTPFYFKLSNREIHEHFRALLDAVDLPIVLYSVPKFTGVSLEPAVIAQLASERENMVGVKDSSGSIATIVETIRLVGDKIAVLAGTADVALPTLMLGGKGAVLAVANVLPKMCSHLYRSFRRGNYAEAAKLQRQISHLNDVLVKRLNQISAIKEALNLRGLPAGYPRKPALQLEDEEIRTIENALKIMPEP